MVVYQPPVQHIMAGDRVRVLDSCPTSSLRGAVGIICSGTIESCKLRIPISECTTLCERKIECCKPHHKGWCKTRTNDLPVGIQSVSRQHLAIVDSSVKFQPGTDFLTASQLESIDGIPNSDSESMKPTIPVSTGTKRKRLSEFSQEAFSSHFVDFMETELGFKFEFAQQIAAYTYSTAVSDKESAFQPFVRANYFGHELDASL